MEVTVARLNHLDTLLKNLPASLPSEPVETRYHFGLDQSEIAEEGVFFALTQNLERCFQVFALPFGQELRFTERGQHCQTLVRVLKDAVRHLSESDRELVADRWIERLIAAAKGSGGTIPKKRCVN